MTQSFLKPGDYVKYRRSCKELDEQGFILDRVYELAGGNMTLGIFHEGVLTYLVKNGDFTEFSDNFSKYMPGTHLSKGRAG